MARIFTSFYMSNFLPEGAICCFYEGFIKGLKDKGNDVFAYISNDFAYDFSKPIPNNLLEKIKKFNPDFIFLFNNKFYDISKEFDCPIIIYEVDTPLYYSNKNILKQNIDRYKFIVGQPASYDVLINEYKAKEKNILIAPYFTEVRNENVEIKNNIVFIGTKFSSCEGRTIFSNFMSCNPTNDEIIQYKFLINEVLKNPFITDEEIFEKYNINSDAIKYNFSTDYVIRYLSDYNRVKVLSSISDLGLKIYGSTNWALDNYNEPYLILNYDKTPKYSLKHNQDVYNSSKIGININHIQAREGFSWRVCDILASNACLVSENKSDLKKYFPNVNIPVFDNIYEARELCIKLLNNENMRADIVAAANEVIDKNYRVENVLKLIEDYFGFSFMVDELNKDADLFIETQNNVAKSEPYKFQLKKRLKNIIYLFILFLGQFPIIDLFVNKKQREKLLVKIKKYER